MLRLILCCLAYSLTFSAEALSVSMVGGGPCPTTPSAATVTRYRVFWAGGNAYLYPNSTITTGGEITRVDYHYKVPSSGAEVDVPNLYTGATFTDGLDVTFTIGWSGCTAVLNWSYGAASYKYDRTIDNPTLSTLKVEVTQKDPSGNVLGTTTEFLAPGDQLRVQFDEAAPGTIEYKVTALNSDGTPQETYTASDGPSSSVWQLTDVDPTPGSTISATVPIPQDTTSKSTGNIDFNTGSTDAKDETLRTGFNSLRKAIAETGTDQRNQSRQIENAVEAGTAAQVSGNSLLSDIKGLLTTAKNERDDAESGAGSSTISAWNASGAAGASSVHAAANSVFTDVTSSLTTAWLPTVTPTPTLWDFPLVGTINPRVWETNATIDTIRVYTRGFCQVIILLGMSYLFAGVVSQAYQDVCKATQASAINAAFGATLPVSVPLVIAATVAVFAGLAAVVAAAWSALVAALVTPGSVTAVPVACSEILAIANEWIPITGALTAVVLYASGSVAVRGAALLSSLIRNLIPAS